MKIAGWIVAVALVGAAVACAPAPPAAQGTPDDEVAIRGLAGKYSASFNANDVAALAQMVSEDFENIDAAGTHTQGRAAFQQMEEQGLRDRQSAGLKLTLNASTGYVKWIDATHAIAGGTYTMEGLPPGAPAKGSWMIAVRKADGKWLMTNSLVSEFVAPPPPPPDPKGKGGS